MKFLAAIAAAATAAFYGATASANILTVADAPPGIQQSQQGPCIFGDNSGGCGVLFDANGSNPNQMRTSIEYTVGEIVAAVGAVFGVGIDVNEAVGATNQILDFFNMEVDSGMGFAVVDTTNMAWELDATINNGNGISDLIIAVFDLSMFGNDAIVRFNVGLSNLSGGRDQFLFLNLDNLPEIPVPGAIWLMVAGLAGLGFSARRKAA